MRMRMEIFSPNWKRYFVQRSINSCSKNHPNENNIQDIHADGCEKRPDKGSILATVSRHIPPNRNDWSIKSGRIIAVIVDTSSKVRLLRVSKIKWVCRRKSPCGPKEKIVRSMKKNIVAATHGRSMGSRCLGMIWPFILNCLV